MATTAKGYRYPLGTDNNDNETAIQNLATDIDTDAGPFTTATINAFAAAKKWVGRVVFNSTTNEFWWWDGVTWQIFGFVRGEIREWPSGAGSPPVGWLFAEGAAVSRTTYAALFAIYGTAFGAGDGSTTFNLPNKQGRVTVGRDTGQTEFDVIGENGGAKTKTLAIAELPAHDHTANHLHTASTNTVASHSHSGTSTAAAGGHSHTASSGIGTLPFNVPVHQTSYQVGSPGMYLAIPDNNALGEGTYDGATVTASGHVHLFSIGAGMQLSSGSTAGHSHSVSVTGVGDHSHGVTVAADGSHGHTVTVNTQNVTTSSVGSGTAISLLQPYTVSRYIVKY